MAEDEDSKKTPNEDTPLSGNRSLPIMGSFLDRLRQFREMFRDVPTHPETRSTSTATRSKSHPENLDNQDMTQASSSFPSHTSMHNAKDKFTPGYEQSKQKQSEGEIDQLISTVRNIMKSPTANNQDKKPKKKK